MSENNLKQSDAFILMQFREAVSPLKGKPLAEITAEMGIIGRPFFDQLKNNGHEWPDAIALMRAVWSDIKKGE